MQEVYFLYPKPNEQHETKKKYHEKRNEQRYQTRNEQYEEAKG
jgi:hypothetical protein